MRLRLTPRDTSFLDLLRVSAEHLVAGAALLAELLGADPAGREEVAKRLQDVERDADDATHEIMRRLSSTFVTPFDRQDIYALAAGLDDCMDHMEAAGDLVVLYRVDRLPTGVADQVQVIQRQAEITAAVMPRLRSGRDLAAYWVEINRLENQADRTFRRLLADLLDGTTEAVTVMKVQGVLQELEAVADAFEHVAHTIEAIVVKES